MLEHALPLAPMRLQLERISAIGGDNALDQKQELNRFLADVERHAFRIARFGVRDADEALDIVQDAMIQLVKRYANRDADEWRPLFYRILGNRIKDWHRRHKVRARVMVWWGRGASEEDAADPVERAPGAAASEPQEQAIVDEALGALEEAVASLPPRQQQAFLLRTMESLDVAQTAKAMGCSAGSVKTHYSRAVHSLREKLGDYWS